MDLSFTAEEETFAAEVRGWLDTAYPDAVLIPEGPEFRTGERLAFDADFELVIFPAHGTVFDNGGAGVMAWHEQVEPFFGADGQGSTRTFLDAWRQARLDVADRPVILASADHDFSRLACGSRTAEQLGAAFTFLFTFGTVPCLYYGDEIGMRYLPGLPNVEGAICHPSYNRAGCRTPMQWDDGPNAGFSAADPSALYLPIDPSPDRPTVQAQDGLLFMPGWLRMADLVVYNEGSVVSRQITKAEAGNVTLFAFDAGQELSEHTAPFDALHVCHLRGPIQKW